MYRVSYGNCNSSSNRLWDHARCVYILLIMVDMDKLAEMVHKLVSTVESQATEMLRVSSVLDNLTKLPAVVATPASSSESVGTDAPSSTTHLTIADVQPDRTPSSTLRELGKDIPQLNEKNYSRWVA